MLKRTAFVGGHNGSWRVLSVSAVQGPRLDLVSHLDVRTTDSVVPSGSDTWVLEGQASNLRYATRAELTALRSRQEGLGRPQARRAAMIPIKKSAAWWDLPQDERRAIFEETSQHTAIGLKYLPEVARQLYHCRDLGQPFDFVTWFEYAAEHSEAFEHLVASLRDTPEWQYVEREVDIRLEREP
jgi:hypothetical protein